MWNRPKEISLHNSTAAQLFIDPHITSVTPAWWVHHFFLLLMIFGARHKFQTILQDFVTLVGSGNKYASTNGYCWSRTKSLLSKERWKSQSAEVGFVSVLLCKFKWSRERKGAREEGKETGRGVWYKAKLGERGCHWPVSQCSACWEGGAERSSGRWSQIGCPWGWALLPMTPGSPGKLSQT